MHGIEQQIVTFLQNLFNTVGWPGVVAAMGIESACIPLPSEVTMPLAGWMLVQAKGLTIWGCLWAAFYGGLGCTIGSVITYWIGALGGRPLLEKYGKYVLISRHDMDTADKWFTRYGQATAFVSRLLPVVRTFISLPLGITRMNFVKFTVLSFVGSFIWSGALAAAGYAFGSHWETVREAMRPFDIPILIILVAAVGYYIYRHIKHSREQSDAAAPVSE
jgi:membrane protein DedA with SNARE-associated domain